MQSKTQIIRAILAVCLVLGLMVSISAVYADTVTITARTASGAVTGDPPYKETGVGTNNWQNSSSKSSVSLSGSGSRYIAGRGNSLGAIQLTPTLGTAGGTYKVELTVLSTNCNGDLINDITVTGGTMYDSANVNPITTTNAYQISVSGNKWGVVGYVRLNAGVTTPVITFTINAATPGTTPSGSSRWYSDSYKFSLLGDTPQPGGVTGSPTLNAGGTKAKVFGILPTATDVTVYKVGSATPLGTYHFTGAAPASQDVTTTPLVRGDMLVATQTVTGKESAIPITGGPVVGVGPNGPILLTIGMRETLPPLVPEPVIGSAGGTTGIIEWLGSDGIDTGAPRGKLIVPSNNWQTVTFTPGVDPMAVNPMGLSGNGVLDGTFGVLEHLAITPVTCNTKDTGSFQIYLDTIKNGTTQITGFEGYSAGSQVIFRQPSFSSTTSGFLLGFANNSVSPNNSVVDTTIAAEGTNSDRIEFQFTNSGLGNFLRLTSFGASNIPNPIVDFRLPISLKILLKPAAGSGTLAVTDPADQTVFETYDAVFTTSVTGYSGTRRYQWFKNGYPIAGATSASLTLTNVQLADNGAKVRVVVRDNLEFAWSSEATLHVNVLPPLSNIGSARNRKDGSTISLPKCVVVTSDETFDTPAVFYVQDLDGSSGIRVEEASVTTFATTGMVVQITGGTIETNAATGERYIENAVIDATGAGSGACSGTATPKNWRMRNNAVGGSGYLKEVTEEGPVADGGLITEGLLVTTIGKLIKIEGTGPYNYYLDDGCGVTYDYKGTNSKADDQLGIKVTNSGVTLSGADIGKMFLVTGIVVPEKVSGQKVRTIWCRSSLDFSTP